MKPYLDALTETRNCPLWHDQNVRPEPCPSLSEDAACELLIVGGGFTGLWAALQARERMPDLDIVVLESTFIGDGASGRNGGMVAKTLTHGEHNADYHFPDEAERIEEIGQANYRELVESLRRHSIDARFEEAGFLDVATRVHQVEFLRKSYETKKKDGLNVTWFDRDEIQKKIHSPTYLAGVRFPDRGGILDPARLCWELKRVLLDLGVRIFENTPMLGFETDGTGMKTACPDGSVRSKKILMATNAFPNPLGATGDRALEFRAAGIHRLERALRRERHRSHVSLLQNDARWSHHLGGRWLRVLLLRQPHRSGRGRSQRPL
jgi:glycine/D-amino acid oxidase-like deaminating enzyme